MNVTEPWHLKFKNETQLLFHPFIFKRAFYFGYGKGKIDYKVPLLQYPLSLIDLAMLYLLSPLFSESESKLSS